MRPGLHLFVFGVLALCAAGGPARADTLLRLSETDFVSVSPDELAAGLKAGANAPTAAEVQDQVNRLMAGMLTQIRAEPGVQFSTGSYQVFRNSQTGQWIGEQTVELHGSAGEAMLKLVGTLQGQGLTLTHLGWRVAPDTARKAQDSATKMALSRLHGRADEAAAILGLRFASFREVRIGGVPPYQPVMPRMMAASAKGDATPPAAETEQVRIEATVEADVVLVAP